MKTASTLTASTPCLEPTYANFAQEDWKPLRIRRSAKSTAATGRKNSKKARKPPIRKRIKSSSESRKRDYGQYHKLVARFLKQHPRCMACQAFGLHGNHKPTEVHHSRGRVGRLLCDTRFWIATCSSAHRAIHNNPKLAQRLGLLAGPGEWNVFPKK